MNPETPKQETVPALPANTLGYCRACGKALEESTMRTAQGAIYCAEHVPQTPPPLHAGASPFGAQPYVAAHYTAPAASPYTAAQVVNAQVSPAMAFALGLIPGVGAIYNGQYAKGLVHALILGVLLAAASTSIPGVAEPVTVLLVITFWAYMPFEAFHTAVKRRKGLAVDEFSGLSAGGSTASRFPAAAVLLIAFGIVFLLNNLDLLDVRRILRYWPVLMIGLGVYLLWMRVAGAGRGSSGNGAGGGTGGQV